MAMSAMGQKPTSPCEREAVKLINLELALEDHLDLVGILFLSAEIVLGLRWLFIGGLAFLSSEVGRLKSARRLTAN